MRIVKYLTLTILLCAVLTLTGTIQLLYSVNFAFGSIRAYYELQLVQDDMPLLCEIANKQDMILCIVDNRMASTQEFDVYSTANESDLCDMLRMQFGTFRSIFYQKPVQIRAHSLNDYTVPEDSIKLYFIGSNQAGLERILESHFTIQGGIMVQQDASSMLIIGWIAWGLLIVFAFFLSAFDAESKWRTCFIRVMNGASPAEILLCNIGIELLVMTGIICIVSYITNSFVTVETGKQFWSMGGLLILSSIIPYIKLADMSYTVITQERLTVTRLLNFGYIYKTLLLCMTMTVFSLTASLGTDFFRYLRVLQFAKKYEDYSIIKIETTEASLLGDVEEAMQYMELTNLRIEEIYQKYFDSNHALLIDPYNIHSDQGGMIYCNSNASDYIESLFGEYREEMNADVCIFAPEGIAEINQIILNAKQIAIPYYFGMNWEPDIKVIRYHGKKTGFYLSAYEDSLLTLIENPIVAYVMRTPKEIGVSINDTQKISVNGMAFRMDDTMLNELQTRSDIHCEITPIGITIRQQFNQSQRICGALALICAVFIALNFFVSGFLIQMEYRLRAKEYCIKTVLGYTMLQKFGSFLTMSVMSILVSIVIMVMLRNQIKISPILVILICSSMLIVDTMSIFVYVVKTERSSIVNCLKGGAL
ncbi:MAG: hypothetical protein K2G25_06720 [Oscillospiraceae bacterium]|nr:hypothetical protein [Oscillospiraceae bacterium]